MRYSRMLLATCLLGFGAIANADVGVSLRAGTLGAGADLNVGLSEKLNLRLGYSMYDYDAKIEDTDVVYDGELKLRNASLLLDWHVFGGGFRLSLGAVGANTEIDVVGRPTGGSYEIGDATFTAAEVGHVDGKMKMGNSVAPYLGFGWGNTVDKGGRITFLFDIGAIYTGAPELDLNVRCGVATQSRCALLQQEAQREEDEMSEEATEYELYPVIGLGLAIRF